MNTLDDLRSTLRREAEFDDTESRVRPVLVRGRIRAVRRRRAGVVAASAAVAVILATGTVGVLRDGSAPAPAGPSLGDVQVPQRIDVHGFPYELSATERAADDGSFDLEDDPEGGPLALSLVATGLGSGQATLWSGYWPIARVRGDEQLSVPTDGVVLSELRVEFDGTPKSARAEVAVYEPTGDLAPGVAADGVVFRQQVGDRELVTAAFGTAGDDASVDVPDIEGDVDVAVYCQSATPGLYLKLSGSTGGTPCDDLNPGFDPGASNPGYLPGPRPGDRVYSVHVTQGEDGPRATGVDVTFGFGIYRLSVAPTEVLGHDVPTVVEANGRTWRLDETQEWTGDDDFAVDTSQGDVYIGAAYDGALEMSMTWRGAPEGGWGGFRRTNEEQGPGAMFPGLLLAGEDTVQLHLAGPNAEGRLLVYRPE